MFNLKNTFHSETIVSSFSPGNFFIQEDLSRVTLRKFIKRSFLGVLGHQSAKAVKDNLTCIRMSLLSSTKKLKMKVFFK